MAFFFNIPSLLILVNILLLVNFITASPNKDIVAQTCKAASVMDPKIQNTFCIEVFMSYHRSHAANNLTSLGLIAIDLVKNKSTTIISRIEVLVDGEPVSIEANRTLHECGYLYAESIHYVNEITSDYTMKGLKDALVKTTSVKSNAYTCEKKFQDRGVPSMLTEENHFITQLAAILFCILQMIQRG